LSSTQTKEKERTEENQQEEESQAPEKKQGSGRSSSDTVWLVARYLTMPLFLGGVCLALYLWVASIELDSIEQRTLNAEYITQRVVQHLQITGVATVIVVAISVTAGVLLTRPAMKRVSPYIAGVASTGQAVPSIGVLVLFAIFTGNFGFDVAVLALIVYAFLPVLRNTMVGIQQVDPSIIEAGRGMGMTKTAVLFRIELPLAIPIMLAGIRTALIIVVGTAALATFINAGGMGDIINTGIKLSRDSILVTGAVLTAVLALVVDYVAGVFEAILRPKGL
jgi:osmoprotectant transport system permease protein